MKEFRVYVEAALEVEVLADSEEEAEEIAGELLVSNCDYITDIRHTLAEEV